MAINFCGIVQVALAYALVVGWEGMKPIPTEQTEQSRHVGDHESLLEIAQAGE